MQQLLLLGGLYRVTQTGVQKLHGKDPLDALRCVAVYSLSDD